MASDLRRLRNGRPWRDLAARLKIELPPVCHVCGQPIDLTLDAQRHPRGWTLDHVLPLIERPDLALAPSNLRPAHRSCNGRKGAGRMPLPPTQSRVWD